jgi:hypothetical protein
VHSGGTLLILHGRLGVTVKLKGARPHFGIYIYIYIYQYIIYLHIPYIPSLCRNICKNVGWALALFAKLVNR